MANKDSVISNAITQESKDEDDIVDGVKLLLENILEHPNVAEREEGELVESESEIELETSEISKSLTTVDNSSSIETKQHLLLENSQKFQNKTFITTSCFQKNPEYDGTVETQRRQLVADSLCIGKGGEFDETVIRELKYDIQILKGKCSEVKSKLQTANERVLLKDFYRDILELKMELSQCLETLESLKSKDCGEQESQEKANRSIATKNKEYDFESSSNNTEVSELKSCKCSKNKYCGTCQYEEEHKHHRNISHNSRYCEKFSYKTCHDSRLTSIYSDTRAIGCPRVSSSISPVKTRTSNDKYCSKVETCSLIYRQVDFINKHVSKVGPRRSSNNSRDPMSVNKSQRFNGEVRPLEDMESFLSLLKKRKRKRSDENNLSCKKRKASNRADSNSKRFSEGYESVTSHNNNSLRMIGVINTKRKKIGRKMLNYFSTMSPLTKILKEQTGRQISSTRFDESDDVQIKKELSFEKFTGEIKTLEDMEAFLAFLRKRKALNKEKCYKISESNSKGKDAIEKLPLDTYEECKRKNSDQDSSEVNTERRINSDGSHGSVRPRSTENMTNWKNSEAIKTGETKCKIPAKSSITENKLKSPTFNFIEKFKMELKNDELSADESNIKMSVNEISKKDGELILKPLSVEPKSKASDGDIISRQPDKTSNGSNRENEEISSKEMELFLQQVKASETEGRKTEEISVGHSNHEMKVDRFLKLARERRKAKLMACVATKPEKISKILRDLEEKKGVLIGDKASNEEYEKVLKKIVSETKAISMT